MGTLIVLIHYIFIALWLDWCHSLIFNDILPTNIPSIIAGRNTVSYKDVNLSYIDGILEGMREEFKTSNTIPINLQYHHPKAYTIGQEKQLSERVRKCWFASGEELDHVETVAAQLKRKIIIIKVSNFIYSKKCFKLMT